MARRTAATIVPVHSDPDLNALAAQIAQQYVWRANYWRPMHDRQDYWSSSFHLLDALQMSKPAGMARFISNDPQTAPQMAVNILTRNHTFWDIDTLSIPGADQAERDLASLIEGAIAGIVDDLSMLFLQRGEMAFWSQAAWFAIIKGWIAGKFIVTEESGRDDDVPIQGEFWDFRFTYPVFDGAGLHSVIKAKEISMAQLIGDYGDNEKVQQTLTRAVGGEYDIDLSSRAYKLEWWDFRRKRQTGVLAMWPGDASRYSFSLTWGGGGQMLMNGVWVIEPYDHGYDSTNCPIVITPVNGLPFEDKPMYPAQAQAILQQRSYNTGMKVPSWYGPGAQVADMGRSLLASVEDHNPQYNEFIAMMYHRMASDAYGSWVLKTRNGQLVPLELGIGAVNALRLEEQLERAEIGPVNPDALRLLSIIADEKQKGTLSNILQSASPFQGPGYLFQQVRNTALNGIAPYTEGLSNFGMMFARSMLNQLRDAAPGKIELVHRSRANTLVRVEFDPAVDLADRQYKVMPRFEPAVPDDLALQAQTARLLLDPRRPIFSLEDVLERVFRHPDSAGVQKRIFKDMAHTDPLIMLLQIAQALREEGQDELAERIETQEFQLKFVEDVKWKQFMAAAGVQPGGNGVTGLLPGGEEQGAGAGLGPEAGGTGAPGAAQEGMTGMPGGGGMSNNFSGGNV